jgi:putative peptidoglycan lipid II flippase
MKKLSFLARTSLLIGVFFGLDKVLAFARFILISRKFTLPLQDSFNAANNLPDLLFALISGGALAMAFVPVLSQVITLRGRPAAWDLFSRVANLAFLVTAALAVIIAVFADQIVRSQIGIAPGFGPEQQELITNLMRLNLIATIIFSISGLVMASLQANQHFLLPAMAPLLYNVGQIFGVVVLAPRFGIQGVVYGVIIGALLHLGIQIPGLVKYQFHWTPSLNIREPVLLETLRVIGPRLLTMFLLQSMALVRDNLASRLGQDGAVSALTYGWMIMQVPETLLGTAIATAMLPTLAEFAARADWESFRTTIEKAIRVMLVLTLPVAAILVAGISPLLHVAFTKFDSNQIGFFVLTVRIFLLTLSGFAIQEVLARSFYARKEAWTAFFSVVIRTVVYLLVSISALVFFRQIGAPAIALAEFAATIEAIVLYTWLNQRLPERMQVSSAILKGLTTAVVSGIVTYAIALYLPGGAVVTALIGMSVGGIIALAMVWSEAKQVLNL